MPTLEQLKSYYASIKVPLPPDFILQAWLDTVASIQPCMDGAGYPESTQLMIYIYLLGLFGIAGADGQISSQTAPSGASQSFHYKADGTQFANIRSLLRGLDKSGCTDSLVPSIGNQAALFVSKGCGCQ